VVKSINHPNAIHTLKFGVKYLNIENTIMKNTSNKIKLKVEDPVVKKVIEKFAERCDFGMKKYGRSLHQERILGLKGLGGYLNDIQEELMDAIVYIQTAKDEVKSLALSEKEESDLLTVRDSYAQGL
jgi:hypothetical protein